MTVYIDVSVILSTKFLTGIQRVVREFTKRLVNGTNEIVLISYNRFSGKYSVIDSQTYLDFLEKKTEHVLVRETISLHEMNQGDLFVDLDSVWNLDVNKRSTLYPELKKQNVRIGTLIYDIIPVSHPQFAHKDTVFHFAAYMSAVLEYSDFILTNTKASKEKIQELIRNTGATSKEIYVIPLAFDYAEQGKAAPLNYIRPEIRNAEQNPYILMLGTIEPRKNHRLLLQAFDKRLKEENLNIVFAGRVGWNMEETMETLYSHPEFGKRIFFIEKPSDSEVTYLYEHAFGLVFASFEEGYGLPVIEAFHNQCVVFASDIDTTREVAGNTAVYFESNNVESLISVILDYRQDEKKYRRLKSELEHFSGYTWDESARMLSEVFTTESQWKGDHPMQNCDTYPAQLFFLSARTEDFLETVHFYEEFMPWIREVVLCCPERKVSEISSAWKSLFSIRFITDEELLEGKPAPKDHQQRNFYLRSKAILSGKLDPVFIMADDDNRPLTYIPTSYFLENGKMKFYYFSEDMHLWRAVEDRRTSYDDGVRFTLRFLDKNGLPSRHFSCHEPQIISSFVFSEALRAFPEVMEQPIDEWSFYGNYLEKYYANSAQFLPYTTMCWPALPSDWKVTTEPTVYMFENFYPVLYEEGQIFDGFSTTWKEEVIQGNFLKIQKRLALQKEYASGMAVNDLAEQIYHMAYHEKPVWRLDVKRRALITPRIILGRAGFVIKTEMKVQNCPDRVDVSVKAHFQEKNTNKVYGFEPFHCVMSSENNCTEFNIHLPKEKFEGTLHLSCDLAEKGFIISEIPVTVF